MIRLFRIAFASPKYYLLFAGTFISLIMLSLASQLEICALGVMANKGPSVFELFGDESLGGTVNSVELESIEQQWALVDTEGKGYISKADAAHYIATHKSQSIVDKMLALLDDNFNFSGNIAAFSWVLISVAGFKALSMFLQRLFARLVSIKISKDLRGRYFEHLQSLPMEFYQKYNMGTLSARVSTDAYVIAESMNAFLLNFLQMPFILITTGILCLMTSTQLSLVIFAGFPLIIYPVIYLAKHIKRIAKKLQKNQEGFATVLIDFIGGIQTVKMYAMEDFSLRKYHEQNERMAALERKVARYDVSSRPIIHSIGMVFLGVTMLYGLYGLKMGVAELFFYCGLLYVFYEPIKKYAENNNVIQRGIAASERMYEVLDMKPQLEDSADAVELPGFSDEIVFDDVWFKYEEQWVLKGLSFKVRRGEKLAVVGPTGAGKSTIVQLLPRLYDVQKGSITIDGKPLSHYTCRSIREAISFVPQKPFLFLDTIAENIGYGRPYSREQIRTAAKKAHASEFIEKMPEGYDSILSEAGKNLSGGQQQRLAIARALVKDAPILVMDEATSALDNVSEQYIKEAMNDLKGKLTQIVIAHRLSTIADADRILFIDKGRIIGEGTKDELLESCPQFKLMWELRDSE